MEKNCRMKVLNFEIEQTGGYVYVAWGSLNDGTYFAIGDDLLVIYDEDEYKAMESIEYGDGYEWQNKHTINSYSYPSEQYKEVLKQVYDKCKDSDKDRYDLFRSLSN